MQRAGQQESHNLGSTKLQTLSGYLVFVLLIEIILKKLCKEKIIFISYKGQEAKTVSCSIFFACFRTLAKTSPTYLYIALQCVVPSQGWVQYICSGLLHTKFHSFIQLKVHESECEVLTSFLFVRNTFPIFFALIPFF